MSSHGAFEYQPPCYVMDCSSCFPPLVNGFTKSLQEVRVNISTSLHHNGGVDMNEILENAKEVIGTMGFTSPKKKPSHTESKAKQRKNY